MLCKGCWILTVVVVGPVNVHVQILVALERVLQQLDLLVTLDTLGLCVLLALAVALELVQAHHLLDSILVLLLDTELELKLGQHELNAGSQVLRVIADKICDALAGAPPSASQEETVYSPSLL